MLCFKWKISGEEEDPLKRISWFLLFQIFFLAAALADFFTTWFGISFLGGHELHENYGLGNAAAFWTFINIVFFLLRPEKKWQIPRLAFLAWAFWPAIRNLIMILSVTV